MANKGKIIIFNGDKVHTFHLIVKATALQARSHLIYKPSY